MVSYAKGSTLNILGTKKSTLFWIVALAAVFVAARLSERLVIAPRRVTLNGVYPQMSPKEVINSLGLPNSPSSDVYRALEWIYQDGTRIIFSQRGALQVSGDSLEVNGIKMLSVGDPVGKLDEMACLSSLPGKQPLLYRLGDNVIRVHTNKSDKVLRLNLTESDSWLWRTLQ